MKEIKITANTFSSLKPLKRSQLVKLTAKGSHNCPSGFPECICGTTFLGCVTPVNCVVLCPP